MKQQTQQRPAQQQLKPKFENRMPTRQGFEQSTPDIVEKPTRQESNYIVIPEKVLIKPYIGNRFRLGLEATKEEFVRIPGTSYRWEPSRVGNTYKTGLEYVSPEFVAELERKLGKKLDDEFYMDMTYVMDGSNPHGHLMDLRKASEVVVYLAMLDSQLIARNKLQKNTGEKPEAEWYIEDLEAEAEIESLERDKYVKMIRTYDDMSDDKKATIAKIMGVATRGISAKVAKGMLWKMLDDKKRPDHKKVLERFMQVADWSDAKLNVSEEVEDAISLNIIRRNSAQDYVYGDDILGATKDQVVSKMLDNTNSGFRMSIKSQLNLRP